MIADAAPPGWAGALRRVWFAPRSNVSYGGWRCPPTSRCPGPGLLGLTVTEAAAGSPPAAAGAPSGRRAAGAARGGNAAAEAVTEAAAGWMNPDGRLTPFPRAGSLWVMRPTYCIPIPLRVLGVDTGCAEATVTCTPLLPMGMLPDPLDVVDWHKWLLRGVVAPYPSARARAARRAAERHGRNRP